MLSSAEILDGLALIGWTVVGILILCGIYLALRYQDWRQNPNDSRYSASSS